MNTSVMSFVSELNDRSNPFKIFQCTFALALHVVWNDNILCHRGVRSGTESYWKRDKNVPPIVIVGIILR